MTKREAEDLGLENMLGRLFRFSDGKNNLALPASGGTQWMKLASVGLGNGEGEGLDRMVSGDSVGVVEVFGGLDGVRDGEAGQLLGGGDLDRLVAAVGEAQRLGANRQSYRAGDMWVGRYIARAMELDVEDKGDRARIKRAINKLIAGGYAKEVNRNDAHRTKRLYVELTATSEHTDNVSEMEAFG
ncbi:hypothetical protein MACH17_01380 [Phaeobacter inhibens]|uniref:hypothetical protein n=1 Tax=Phaeobacter inhibens TaxID=221822 RepID=UPI00274E0E0B|nr:hypothetical protein [Phaeobacter inhibens]GLO68621.1 hypothetical protein MACH17_01380 [Phaeobacter inhibens]